jgi:spore maturation protein CgeB
MTKIIYSFNKRGFEAAYWGKEIAAASNQNYKFIPFNHDPYLDASLYSRAQLLDNLYYEKNQGLVRLYSDIKNLIIKEKADVLLVDNCFPYHPEFLKRIYIYKVLRTSDGPICAYDRDFAYLHAYDHILYHSPAYSKDMGMDEKLVYCGSKRIDFWPLASFDAISDSSRTDADILSGVRDIDVIFIGALHLNKMPLIAAVKKALGKKFILHGLTSLKKNIYFNIKYGFLGWVKPVAFADYVKLYQRAKIGINIHNRGDYTVGSYRLFDLPANGVMQISDGGEYLNKFFAVGKEIVAYRKADELIDLIKYYLAHDEERKQIALSGFRRVRKEYKIAEQLVNAGELIKKGLQKLDRN